METKPVLTSWRWEVAGKPVAVELELSVVDSLGAEILRTVGAVPRRGIEVGGILHGTVTAGNPAVVHIRDFEPVPIEYLHGPSYVPSDADLARFAEAVQRPRSSPEGPLHAVGYYRSHTRDGLSLAPEDVQLFSELFPAPEAVILLVHPSVLQASTAGFFFREGGVLNGEKSALEFPFRRPDLGGGPVQRVQREERERHPVHARNEALAIPPPAPPIAERPRPERRMREVPPPDELPSAPADARRPPVAKPAVTQTPARTRAAWVAFMLALLTFGLVAGYHAAGGRLPWPGTAVRDNDPYALRLSTSQSGDGILVRWNTEGQAIQSAWRGVLTVTEGTISRAIQLDLPQLRNGSVLYRRIAPDLRFRLDVYLSERRIISEMADWGAQGAPPAEIRPPSQ